MNTLAGLALLVDISTGFELAIATLTAFAGLYAVRAGKRGKDAELQQKTTAERIAQEQEDRRQRFEELKTSLDAARVDLNYYERQLDRARTEADTAEKERDRLQDEWMKRHKALLQRCQALATQMEAIINGPVRLPPDQRRRIKVAVQDLETHITEDHEHFDDPIT